jgi:hypothetical protein
VNLKPLLPTTAICTGSRRRRVMANWMQAQSPIHRWLMCIHQARGGEQNPAGKKQVVKGLLQRGTAASTARQLEQVKQDTPQHELAHYQLDPAGSQAPHCLPLAVSCGCELPIVLSPLPAVNSFYSFKTNKYVNLIPLLDSSRCKATYCSNYNNGLKYLICWAPAAIKNYTGFQYL